MSRGDAMKACFRCGKEKLLSEFYAHPRMTDGRLGKCKECTKTDTRNNYRANREQYREYERMRRDLPHRVLARELYAQTPNGRERRCISREKWEQSNPGKKAAERAISRGVRSGTVKKLFNCQVCGSPRKVEAHHEDYSQPYSVMWLCKKHHWQADVARRGREHSLEKCM
jgi:hypothetical protein